MALVRQAAFHLEHENVGFGEFELVTLAKDAGERSVAYNVLGCQFPADAPNRKWIADFTCI